MSDVMDDDNRRWLPEELLTKRKIRLMWWYLMTQVPPKLRVAARRHGKSNSDLIQDACVYLLRFPPTRVVAVTTAVCNAVRWSLLRTNLRTRLDALQFESLSNLDQIDERMPFDLLMSEERTEFVNHLLRFVSPRTSGVLKLRFGIGCDEKPLHEIGNMKEFWVCQERIRQLEKKGLEKLRSKPELFFDRSGEPKVQL